MMMPSRTCPGSPRRWASRRRRARRPPWPASRRRGSSRSRCTQNGQRLLQQLHESQTAGRGPLRPLLHVPGLRGQPGHRREAGPAGRRAHPAGLPAPGHRQRQGVLRPPVLVLREETHCRRSHHRQGPAALRADPHQLRLRAQLLHAEHRPGHHGRQAARAAGDRRARRRGRHRHPARGLRRHHHGLRRFVPVLQLPHGHRVDPPLLPEHHQRQQGGADPEHGQPRRGAGRRHAALRRQSGASARVG